MRLPHVRLLDGGFAAWEEAGRILGLRFKTGALLNGRRMRGEFDGVGVIVETYTRSSGKNSTTYTRFRAYHPRPLDKDLKLAQQGQHAIRVTAHIKMPGHQPPCLVHLLLAIQQSR